MIARVPVKGYFEVNCYLWIDDETKHGFIIDPSRSLLLGLCRSCYEKRSAHVGNA